MCLYLCVCVFACLFLFLLFTDNMLEKCVLNPLIDLSARIMTLVDVYKIGENRKKL